MLSPLKRCMITKPKATVTALFAFRIPAAEVLKLHFALLAWSSLLRERYRQRTQRTWDRFNFRVPQRFQG